ncbi:MAG: ATP-dependent DNA helicase, partial [Candidatus Cloacimonetes bacterium]|nr:ATP-dependent DNA helicase [Candidatus Cloacimonadota bacterium]
MPNHTLTVSVRELIESVFLSGDLNLSMIGGNRLLQGAEGHRAIQKKRVDQWQNEFSVRYSTSVAETDITIQGRIDGVLVTEDITIIEEIKTYLNAPEFKPFKLSDYIDESAWFQHSDIWEKYQNSFKGLSFLHWAQGLIYAYIYIKEYDKANSTELLCRVNYVKVQKNIETPFDVICSARFLECFFYYTLNKWLSEQTEYSTIKSEGNESLVSLDFPFPFRGEQRKMSVAVYKSITGKNNLFARAPTGTGKTLAALFPALKAMGERHTEKIFYLTSKTVGQTVAEFGAQLLQKHGANIRYCVITAKEKACLKDYPLCDPDFCQYTHDYYSKQKKAFYEAMESAIWNYDKIKELAQRYQLCPFEFSLYLSQKAEVVICDYNYAFDPIVLIRRHFDGLNHSYTFLVDEAHNMPERAREMYSKELESQELQKWIEEFPNKKLIIYKKLKELLGLLVSLPPTDKEFFVIKEYPSNILSLLESINAKILVQLEKKNKHFVKYYMIKIYFQILFKINSIKTISPNHVIYYQRVDTACTLKVFCINPSQIFTEYTKLAISSTFFSATLHPFDYFCEILGKKETDKRLSLLSPFPKENLGMYIYTGINTLYQNRDNSYQPIADLIYNTSKLKKGNYLVFFPSFAFMNGVVAASEEYKQEANYTFQKRNMSVTARKDFLSLFDKENQTAINSDKSFIAFAVMGGIFGEGIDLIGDKLIGCFIVSVGLPSLGGEKELIKDYYEQATHQGFEYAYRFPGFNKVMQAAGRVIRSENDKGIIVLIDQRFGKQDYIDLYPP